MRSALVVAAAVALVAAPSGTATPSGATAAAAPFAEAWASVPASSAARRAQNIVVFGAPSPVVGFNTLLSCCNTVWSSEAGGVEALHGAFNQNEKGVWFMDLVSAASASKTGLSYTIKPNANWYWGGKKVPVTYKDFVYMLQKIDDPNSIVVGRTGYSNLNTTKFTHKGLKQVTFFWKTANCSTDFPCGAFANWQSLFSGLYPSFALVGADFNKIWTNCICGTDGQPVADGPFYLSNYTPGQGVTLKANPFWAGAKPKIAEVDFKFILDPSAMDSAVHGGQVDAAAPIFGTDLLPLKSTPGLTYDQIPGYFLEHLQFREGDAKGASTVTKGASNVLLRSPWMREAIALGIDRQGVIDAVYGPMAGNTKPMNSFLYFSTQASYTPDFARWNYNPAKALAIMKKHCTAGTGPSAPDATNTKTWQCSGLPATFNWTWNVASDVWTTTERIAKAELKSIGIQIVDKPLPRNLVFGPNGIPSGDYDIADYGELTTGDPGDWYEDYRCFGDGNLSGYCSHTVDGLLKAASSTLDPAKRTLLFRQAEAVMATQVPILPMYQRPIVLTHRSNLLGMVPNPGIVGPFWNIEDWHWRS